MKKYLAGFIIAVALLLLFVAAQEIASVSTSRELTRVITVDELNAVDTVRGDTKLFTMRLEMGDGSVCYALSNEESTSSIVSLDQVVGLGCVK